MKNSENLRLIVKLRRNYRAACDLALLLARRLPITPQINKAVIPKTITPNSVETTATIQKTMSSSVLFAGLAGIFTLLAAIFGFFAWGISWKEGKAKDAEALRLSDENKGKFLVLEKAASDSLAEQQRVQIELANAQKKTADAQNAVLKERWERERMEDSFKPRTINNFRRREYEEQLRRFAGTEVLFVTLTDTEPGRTAQEIASLVESAGWKVLGIERKPEAEQWEIEDGIHVECKAPTPSNPARPATQALSDVLRDSGISSSRSFLTPRLLSPDLPENAVRVVIGLRLESHFSGKKWNEEQVQERLRSQFPQVSPQQPPP